MLELLILWNLAAFRQEHQEDNDFSSGAVAVWILLQLVVWPLSLFIICWQKFRWHWLVSANVAVWFTYLGYKFWGDNFYFLFGIIATLAAVLYVTWELVWNRD